MRDGFRIIKEQTHKYNKDDLVVLVFINNGTYGVDVANSKLSFGRMTIGTKEQTEYSFQRLNELLDDTEDYLTACEKINSFLKCKDFKELIMRIHTDRRTIEKLEMRLLISIFNFETEERHTMSGMHYVKIRARGDDIEYGEFIKTSDSDKYIFKFS
ncbi:MAG TPA: hypothetical protein VMX17_17410 [Candidatus Glassbacteria bacterium]|nr:hypothetical protein [Candidatus Glassbacteria bacterium]